MTTRAEAIAACRQLANCYEDYPFRDSNWTAMRHCSNHRIFALIFEREGRIWINLKAEPMMADFWKSAFSAVVPAYHMNKTHWVSVILNSSMTDEQIMQLIQDSAALSCGKKRAQL